MTFKLSPDHLDYFIGIPETKRCTMKRYQPFATIYKIQQRFFLWFTDAVMISIYYEPVVMGQVGLIHIIRICCKRYIDTALEIFS